MFSSTPNFTEFNPSIIPFQYNVIKDVRKNFDYSNGCHELLLSGSVGSSKSLLMAHLAVTHCIQNSGANFLIGRKSLPSLKETLLRVIIGHLGMNVPYHFVSTTGLVVFPNKSRIISYSWADKNYKKVRSLEISSAAIEELTENDDLEFYEEIKMRLGRIKYIKECFLVAATNPDDPSHPAYKYFFVDKSENKHVYLSKTADNPFLPPSYLENLKSSMDPKLARRMLYGEWISIRGEVVYYAYDPDISANIKDYKINPNHAIRIAYDFNIAEGKPMSAIIFQYIDRKFYCFDEVVIEGSRTENTLDELASRGILDHGCKIIIYGDAAGKARSTKSIKSDYDIISQYLSNYKDKEGRPLKFDILVPPANPPIRERHNIVNGLLKNMNNETRLFLDKIKCKTFHEGLMLTKLKKGGDYIEDDSKSYQHITTAFGYGAVRIKKQEDAGQITISQR